MLPKEMLMRSPEEIFVLPSDVVENMDLSSEQKVAILRQWKDEVLQRQAAEGEAMPGSADDTELLQQITDALIAVGED